MLLEAAKARNSKKQLKEMGRSKSVKNSAAEQNAEGIYLQYPQLKELRGEVLARELAGAIVGSRIPS